MLKLQSDDSKQTFQELNNKVELSALLTTNKTKHDSILNDIEYFIIWNTFLNISHVDSIKYKISVSSFFLFAGERFCISSFKGHIHNFMYWE